MVRKDTSNRNQGAFLQAPVAWNIVSPPHKVAIVSTYDAADLARGHERLLEVLQAFTVKLEEDKEHDLYMLGCTCWSTGSRCHRPAAGLANLSYVRPRWSTLTLSTLLVTQIMLSLFGHLGGHAGII